MKNEDTVRQMEPRSIAIQSKAPPETRISVEQGVPYHNRAQYNKNEMTVQILKTQTS